MNENTELRPDLEENLDLEQLQQKIMELQADLSAAENKAASNWDLLLRAKADEENIRKRSRIDVENAHKYGTEKLARSMLNVLDSLERGIELSNIDNNSNSNDNMLKSLKDGMELTFKLLLDSLEQFGVTMLNPSIGDLFNPAMHEAISIQDQQGAIPNSILAVVQKGFTIHDRVLRPARVVVAKKA